MSVTYDYSGAGQARNLCYGNGIQTEYSYQDDGNGNCIRKSGETYQNEYAYDRMNRLVAAVQHISVQQFDVPKLKENSYIEYRPAIALSSRKYGGGILLSML